MSFTFLEHTADVKVKVTEKSMKDAFRSSAMALKQLMAEKTKAAPLLKKDFVVKGDDMKALLYNFLEEFLYLLDAEDFLITDFDSLVIRKAKKGFELEAHLVGDKASDYHFTNDVKAVTYNDMVLKQEKGKFIIEYVLDV